MAAYQTQVNRKFHNKQLKRKYKSLFEEISSIIYKHDPVGINLSDNPDEYDIETGAILVVLEKCISKEGLDRNIHSIFVKMFDEKTAGSLADYKSMSHNIWVLWEKRRRHI